MQVTLSGNPVKINGQFPQIGDIVKDFTLTKADLSDCSLKDFAGKRKILNIVPSLDTAVCQVSAKKFNEKVSTLNNTILVVISSDLPFAMKRFCSTENLDDVVTLSTFRNNDFKIDYGVDIADGPLKGLTARAVIVLDENNKVIHAELVNEIKDEPNYEQALKVVA